MKIPESEIYFERPTLILVMDRSHAKLYSTFQKNIRHLKDLQSDPLNFETLGRERRIQKGNPDYGVLSAVNDEKLKNRDANHFFRIVAAELWNLYKSKEYEEIVLIIPHEEKDAFCRLLRPEILRKVTRTIPALLTKTKLPEIITRIGSL